MALQKFIFHEGTTENPVVLSQDYVDALIALWADDSVEKDISGVVYKPSLYDSEVDALETIGFTVLTDAQLEDQFTIYPGLEYLNEGEYVDVQANGINAAALSFEILDVKVTYNADNLDEDYIKRKFSFEHNRLVVDSARENASWIAEVTFKAAPQSHPLNYRTAKVTVNAVAISSISITGPSMLNEGDVATYTAQVLPDNNTKPHSAITFTAKYGHFSGNIYTAPVGYSSDEITAMVSAFGRGFSGMKSLVVGTIILNNTDKNPLVFNAIKAALKTSGWTTLGGVAIDEATTMTSIDAYNVSNTDFFNIMMSMKSIASAHTFEEAQHFVNVTEIQLNLREDTKTNVEGFSPYLYGEFCLPNLNAILAYATSYLDRVYVGFLAGTKVTKINLPKLTLFKNKRRDNTSFGIFANMTQLTEVNLPNLVYFYEDPNIAGDGDIFNGDNIQVLNMPNIQYMNRNICYQKSLLKASQYAFVNITGVVYDYLTKANQVFSHSKLEAVSIGAKASHGLTLGSYMFTNSDRLRSVHMPTLISVALEKMFSGCTQFKAFVGNNDYGIDESWDGTDGILDWSKTKLNTITTGVDAFYHCIGLYKMKLPATLNSIKGNAYVWNGSRVCVIDLRNCKNLSEVNSFFYDERSLYNLKFVRFVSSLPPVLSKASCVMFTPTAKFDNYVNSTGISKYFVKNKETKNKLYIYDHARTGNVYNVAVDINSGTTLVYEGKFWGSSNNNFLYKYKTGTTQTYIGLKSNGNTLYVVYNNNNTATVGTNINEGENIRLELTFSDSSIAYKFTNKSQGTTASGTITSNVIAITESSLVLNADANIANITTTKLDETVCNIVPAINELSVPVLYDKVNGKQYESTDKLNNMTVNGSLVESVAIDTSSRVGTYDEIRAEYEQYLVDGRTECTYEYATASNKIFPDEMMDWMCRSIFGFPKTWSGDLEDVPLELLK